MDIIDVIVISIIQWIFFFSGALFWSALRASRQRMRYIYLPYSGGVAKQPRTEAHMSGSGDDNIVIFFNPADQDVD